MVDNFKAVYRILSELEKAMDVPECDVSKFDHEQLGVTRLRWIKYIEMMQDVGYIKGAEIKVNIYDEILFDGSDMEITLKGLEYLQENTIMQRMYKVAKGIKDVVPGF